MTEQERERMSEQISARFLELDLGAVAYLHTFLPIKDKKEVDTWYIIREIKARFPQIRIVVPKADFETGLLQHYKLHEQVELVSGAWGIPEPLSGDTVQPEQLDMVLVPLLAYDTQGCRVGYGKGFYDRFLTGCRPDVNITGLSFFEPVEQIADPGEHDIRLHRCITPNRIIMFNV